MRQVETGSSGWGPSVSGRGRRRRPLRWLALLVLITLVALVAAALWASAQIPREPVENLARTGSPMHVLVVGSDSREGLTAEGQRELSTGSEEAAANERTDTIFVMSISGSDVGLLAFPRDLFVPRCDGSEGRINVAIQIDGPGCLVSTIRELSGIDIAHYVRVTFGGFRDVVDAVGGVELCLEQAIADDDAGIDLPEGCQQLDGQEALGFVRVRNIDNDLERIGRQQTFLRALAGEVASPSTLLNPARLVSVAEEAGSAVALDERTGPIDLARLAFGLRGLASGAAVTETVPTTPETTAGGAQVLDPVTSAAEPLFASFRDGSALDGDARSREGIEVSVLNGTGRPGLAGQVGELLAERGYEVGTVGNTEATERSVIRHPPGAGEDAALVADDVPGDPPREESDEVDGVTLVLGTDAGAGR